MASPNKTSRILWYQAIGFMVIIALSWMDELLDLPERLFGGSGHTPNWRESALESAIALLVWLPVFVATRRMLSRLHYLEDFIRVCAWCRKIGSGDQWIPLEQYFAKGFNVQTSHGICPECAKQNLPGAQGEVQSNRAAS